MTTATQNRRDDSKYTATPNRAVYTCRHRQRWTPSTILLLGLLLNIPISHGFFPPRNASLDFEHKTFTACREPLERCSGSDTYSKRRELCIMGYTGKQCPDGEHYACGRDPQNKFLIEGCFVKNICPLGSSNRLRLTIETESVKLVCVNCDEGHYQDHPADSSVESLNGCSSRHTSSTIENQMSELILIERGRSLSPDKYSCKVNDGYSDLNHQMYCFVNRPCHCTNTVVCQDEEKPDLLPDGTCDAECAVDRDALANFTCTRYAHQRAGSENTTQTNGENKKQPDKSVGLPHGTIAVIAVIGGLILVVMIVGFVFYKRGFCCNTGRQTDTGRVDLNRGDVRDEATPLRHIHTGHPTTTSTEPHSDSSTGDEAGPIIAQPEDDRSQEEESKRGSFHLTDTGDQPETIIAQAVQEVGKSQADETSVNETDDEIDVERRSTDEEIDRFIDDQGQDEEMNKNNNLV